MGLRDARLSQIEKQPEAKAPKPGGQLDLQFLADFLHRKIGMELGGDKRYLVESRLGPIATREKLGGVKGLIDLLKREPGHPLVEDVIDAMTTHETLFFRDKEPFEYLKRTLLPELFKSRLSRRTLRIWSAACSSGQEPYSLAMLIEELLSSSRELGSPRDWKIEIVATDISRGTLRRAEAGIFSNFEVARGLPDTLKARWFRELGDGSWQIKDDIRKRVSFRMQNLTDSPTELGTFDLVLCRNVLIYFGVEDKRKILGRLAGSLAIDGRLMLGGAETVLGITQEFKREPGTAVAVYRKA